MRVDGPWAATGLLALALTLGTGPASAAQQHDPLTVTRDGQHPTMSVDTPLFTGPRRWVPGDTDTVSVWVHNPWDGTADLNVTVTDRQGQTRRDLALSARVAGQPVALGDVGRRLDSNTPVRVDLTATLPRSSTNASQDVQTNLYVGVRLTQVGATTDTVQSPVQSPDQAPEESADLQSEQPGSSGLSVPVAGRHVSETGALPVGVPLTLAAIALAVRSALRGRRHPPARKNAPCPQP